METREIIHLHLNVYLYACKNGPIADCLLRRKKQDYNDLSTCVCITAESCEKDLYAEWTHMHAMMQAVM